MDGRGGMGMSGPASYYMHRGIGWPGSGSQAGLAGQAEISRPMPDPCSNLPVQASNVGSACQVESAPSVSTRGVSVGGPAPGIGQSEPVKRKRGRPRKYGPDGAVLLGLSPTSSSLGTRSEMVEVSVSGSGSVPKRRRGRPPGSGRKQQLASLGEWVFRSAGMGFTPHVITISPGEDITAKIMSFSQEGPRAVCILSANGSVSTVTLRQPATSGGTVSYEGRFEILCLSGSYFLTDDGGSRSRSGGLSISLSSPDGWVIGGSVGGLLIAASPVQVIVGSFVYGGSKVQNKPKTEKEVGGEPELLDGDKLIVPPTSTLPNQINAPSSVLGGWSGTRQIDMRNTHMDIDLTQG